MITKINHKHKKGVWTNMVFASFTDEFNEVAYAIQTIDDITKFKEREFKNIDEVRNKTLIDIGNNFAHKFNSLLISVYGNTYFLKTKLKNTELEKNTNAVLKNITAASHKTTELLPFVQDKQRMNISVNVTEIIENILLKLNIPKHVIIKKSLENSIESIPADPLLIENSLSNIIQNSIESIIENGEITISVKSVYFDIDLSNKNSELKKGKYVRIDISDTGKGISKLNIEKIYDPFFTTKSNIEHAGLGLTISKKIILEHGGIIKEESSLASGTRFLIYLPASDDDNSDLTVKPEELIIEGSNSNIMIVDDEDIVRQVTAKLLKIMGYNVFCFSSGEKAFKFYKENNQKIHIAIIDRKMPVTNGIQTIEKLKTINKDLEFILLTGSDDKEIKPGENGIIIQKPISIEKLSFAISELINKNQL
jgi:signal transduction histidine kinase/CheY-like chemotaxis protein